MKTHKIHLHKTGKPIVVRPELGISLIVRITINVSQMLNFTQIRHVRYFAPIIFVDWV